jgi:SAM-dependent methyltransferase
MSPHSSIKGQQNTQTLTEGTMAEMSGVQKIMLFIIVVLCLNYIAFIFYDKLQEAGSYTMREGFEDAEQINGEKDIYSWITDPMMIYDQRYATIYDQLTANAERSKAKCAILFEMWKNDPVKPNGWALLDAGCGTGHAALMMTKLGVGKVVGLDQSPAMIRYAEKTAQPTYKLTDDQENRIKWRNDTLINSSACSAGEFSHAICLYFTIYYLEDHELFFRHMYFWCKPGGKLAVEVVNKHKFDPMLESASPFIGFSLQKYSKERLRKSKVAFNNFDYEAEFALTDPKADFNEIMTYKASGYVRRQKHKLFMPNIEKLVETAKRVGWTYKGSQDLLPIGFEYGYLLMFEKNGTV